MSSEMLYLAKHKDLVKVKVAQLSPSLCDPMDCSPPGSSAHRISQVRTLEWGAIGVLF